MINICLQSRSQNNKSQRRETSQIRVKFLAFSRLGLNLKNHKYVTFFKKHTKLPNKLPNEF
jgi:hypothetical protein